MEIYGMTDDKFKQMPEHKQLSWNFAAQLFDMCDEDVQNEMIEYVKSELIEKRSGQIMSLKHSIDSLTEI